METLNQRIKYARIVIVIIYMVGLVGLSLAFSRPIFHELTFVNLMFGVFMLVLFHENFRWKQLGMFSFVVVAGFLVELAGVQTGLIFGEYRYGASLGFKYRATPLLIGVNWLMLTYMVYYLFQSWRTSIFVKSALGAFVMVAYDLLLEPLAPKLDLWHWHDNVIPLENYAAWWVLSFIFFLIWNTAGVQYKNKVAQTLLITQMTFFLLLNLVYH